MLHALQGSFTIRPTASHPRQSSLRSSLNTQATTVLLTREAGSNVKVREMLEPRGLRPIEFPLIEFRAREELKALSGLLRKRQPNWTVLTSPQAARVFMEAWELAERPFIKIATFEGTKKVLTTQPEVNLRVEFVPEISNAENLAQTLPKSSEEVIEEVLYPASSKADDTLEKALRKRHFLVSRLDTYETHSISVDRVDSGMLEAAKEVDILTFASPTAVTAWVELCGKSCDFRKPVACIGSTSAKRARNVGFENVYFSENPGLDGLVQSVMSISQSLQKADHDIEQTIV